MDKYRHIAYNPKMRSIQSVLSEVDSSWEFERAQPVTEYEWVAIFRRWDSWAEEIPQGKNVDWVVGCYCELCEEKRAKANNTETQ